MSAVETLPVSAETLLERLDACTLCESSSIEELDVRNLNSRDPDRAASLAEAMGSDFFVLQRLAVCRDCHHVFQVVRPNARGLEVLYDRFALVLAKVSPTEANMFEYLLRHNAKDYVELVGSSLAFLEQEDLLRDTQAALEVRTYGGALAAILSERGIAHVEAAYIQEFDALMARRIFGIDELTPFSFGEPTASLQTVRDRYDLIMMYEGLTHSPDPHEVLEFLDRRLEEGGHAVLFREPNNPEYRRYFPLEVVFNNFHLNLFNEETVRDLFRRDGRFTVRLVKERHPRLPAPLYVTAVVSRPTGEPPVAGSVAQRWGPEFYRSWIRRDRGPLRTDSRLRTKAMGASRRLRVLVGRE